MWNFFFNIYSDDLLNYELGDDIDDQALYGADEDELLLSDDGKLKKIVGCISFLV